MKLHTTSDQQRQRTDTVKQYFPPPSSCVSVKKKNVNTVISFSKMERARIVINLFKLKFQVVVL